jgi:hypothetical protein
MEVSEFHALFGKRIEVRRIDLAAEATNVSPAHVIGHHQQNIGLLV